LSVDLFVGRSFAVVPTLHTIWFRVHQQKNNFPLLLLLAKFSTIEVNVTVSISHWILKKNLDVCLPRIKVGLNAFLQKKHLFPLTFNWIHQNSFTAEANQNLKSNRVFVSFNLWLFCYFACCYC
jgi:hypothetical protein